METDGWTNYKGIGRLARTYVKDLESLMKASPSWVRQLDGVAQLITDPPTTNFKTLSKKREKNLTHDM